MRIPTNEMLDEMLDQVVKRIQDSIQYLKTKFVFDLDQTSSNINLPMLDDPTWVENPGGGGNLSFQDTGLCHSNRKSTTHKSGKLSQKYTHKSGKLSQKYTHKSGEFLKIIPINPGMPKKLTNN